ncbi:MAG TPA: mechanosensitive ion channel domain-containing protein [Methylomirabilota bacterium]|nr:mechanosensitive ion channel domain-containing protein [Methylomirabilota bacterium]
MRRLLAALAVVLALGVTPAWAQERPKMLAPAPAGSKPVPASLESKLPPPPIPLPDIAGRYEGITALLRTIDLLLEPRAEVDAIEDGLPALSTRLAERREATERVLAGSPSLATLDALADSWQPLRIELAAALATLRARALTLEDVRGRLDAAKETWTQTRDEARKAGAPEPVLKRVESVLFSLAAARARLETARGGVLVLQDKVAEAAGTAEAGLASITASRGEETERLFVRDSPPLWSTALWAHPWTEVPARVRQSLRGYRAEILQFTRAARGGLLAQALVVVATAVALVVARRQVRTWPPSDEATPPVLAVLAHPGAAALVLTLLASPWFHRQQPRAAWTLAQVGVMIPMIVVLRPLLAPAVRPGLYVLGAFFLLDLVRGLAVVVPLAEYALFLFEMLTATALMAWVLLSRRGRHLVEVHAPTRRLRTLTVLGRLALLGFATALLSAAVGNMGLARLVGSGVLTSAYIGVLLYAGHRLLSALVMLGLRVWPLSALRMVEHHRALLQTRAIGTLRVVVVLMWAGLSLEFFSMLRPVVGASRTALQAGWTFGTVQVSVGEVLAFGLTVWGSFLVSSFVRFLLAEDVLPRLRVSDGASYAATTLLHYALLFFGFLLSLAALGIDMNRAAVFGGAFGVGLGFGLQNVVSNFISGLIVLFERPIRVGDVVEVGGVAGTVGHIGIRASTIRTWDGSNLIVPNSAFIAERVTNRTPVGRRVAVTLPVRVAYGPAPDKVMTVLCETAGTVPGVVTLPPPAALLTGFIEGGLVFELRAWTSAERSTDVRSALAVAVFAALRNAAMEIPPPSQAVRVELAPPPSVRQRGE